jgi:uncharacterized repeat protein (TIGR01451 family)
LRLSKSVSGKGRIAMRQQKLFLFAVCLSVLITGFPATSRGTDFAAPKSYPVGTAPAFILTGDFNGDGKMDIAVGNAGSNDVSILLGNGDGTFKAAVSFAAGLSPQQMAGGDFNGDGKLDLVVSNSGDGAAVLGSITLLLGKGDGTFQAPATIAADKYPAQLAVADFNEDQKLDLVVGDLRDGGVTLLLGKGDGTFQPGTVILASATGVSAITVGDFNGDKHADVVVGTPDPTLFQSVRLDLAILAGKGDGTFQASASIGLIGFKNPQQTFVTTVSSPHFVAADFNADGKLDLAVRYGMHVHVNPPCGPFTIPCGDTFSDDTNLFAGNGDGTFTGGGIVATFGHIDLGNLGAGDFNADGKLDLVTPRFGTGALELGHGDGTFLSLVAAWTGLGPRAFVAVAELNGDTSPDLIVTESGNNAVAVIVNHSPTSGTDLAVIVSQPPPATPIEGTDFSYRVTIFNEGPQDATGVAVKETLPSGLKLVSATPTQGSCVGTTTITCDLGAMADVSAAAVDFAVTPIAGGTFSDALQVAGSQVDLNAKNDTASFAVTVLVPADISVFGSSSVTTAATGDKVTYTIQVANAGPGPAANVVLTDAISDGNLAVSGLTTSQGSCTPTPGSITCAIGTMNSGAKVNISFALTMGASEAVSNSLNLSADTPDRNGADNSLVLNVNVNPANLVVSESASASQVNVGTQVTYTINVKNNGPAQATNVAVYDAFQGTATATPTNATPSQGTCPPFDANSQNMNCALGTLAPNATATIAFTATASKDGTLSNNATVTSDQPDPDSSDNSTSTLVTISLPLDFSITVPSTNLILSRGGQVTEMLTFPAQGGLTANIDLKCSVNGPSPMPTCGISPSTVAAGSTATLTISAASITASLAPVPNSQHFAGGIFAFGLPFVAFGLVAARKASKSRRGLWLLSILGIAIVTMSAACGGGSSGPPLPQTYTVTVTAATVPNGIQHTTSIQVTLR